MPKSTTTSSDYLALIYNATAITNIAASRTRATSATASFAGVISFCVVIFIS